MNTNIYTKNMIIGLLFALIFSACATVPPPMQTVTAAGEYAAALQVVSTLPRMADGWIAGAQAGTSAWAVNQAANGAPGTFIMMHELGQVAVFIAPAARDNAGNTYWFYGFVDTSSKSIIDICARLGICGGLTTAKTMAEIDAMLTKAGFQRIDAKSIPMVVTVLKAAFQYLKAGGTTVARFGSSTITDMLAIPVYMLGINPVVPDWKFTGIQQ